MNAAYDGADQPLPPIITPAVLEWAARIVPGARVTRCEVRPLAGGAVSRRVEQVTLHLTGGHDPLELVRKDAPALEIAGLRAAQAIRPGAGVFPEAAALPGGAVLPEGVALPEGSVPGGTVPEGSAIPELVASGPGWLVTAMAPGAPLGWGDAVPANVVDALAGLHARYHGGAGLPEAIPRVTPAWWRALCREWVDPGLREHAARHPAGITARARSLIGRAADTPAASAALAALTPTLLHGDVHPGNIVGGAQRATLIDWGGCRVGPAALDLANLVPAGSADLARYARAWRQRTGRALDGDAIELGYRWAALQIPVQYLPWTAGHRPTGDVEAALDQIERAMSELEAGRIGL